MDQAEAVNIVAYWLRWLLDEDVAPGHIYNDLTDHM